MFLNVCNQAIKYGSVVVLFVYVGIQSDFILHEKTAKS